MYAPAPRRSSMRGQRHRRVGLQRGDFLRQQFAARRILVAQVDVDGVDAHRPRGDQHAFQEPVRVALEVVAVLERAGFAFVDVDRHQARRWFGAHDAPLATRRKAGAAQAAQAGVFHHLQHRFDIAVASDALAQCGVTARSTILGEAQRRQRRGAYVAVSQGRVNAVGRGMVDRARADDSGRRMVAAADARGRDHAYVGADVTLQLREQLVSASHRARIGVAYAYGDGRRRRFAVTQHVEVVIEGRRPRRSRSSQASVPPPARSCVRC